MGGGNYGRDQLDLFVYGFVYGVSYGLPIGFALFATLILTLFIVPSWWMLLPTGSAVVVGILIKKLLFARF